MPKSSQTPRARTRKVTGIPVIRKRSHQKKGNRSKMLNHHQVELVNRISLLKRLLNRATLLQELRTVRGVGGSDVRRNRPTNGGRDLQQFLPPPGRSVQDTCR